MTGNGVASEYQGDGFGIYEEIKAGHFSKVYKQKGGVQFLSKNTDGNWYMSDNIGATINRYCRTDNLFCGTWYYIGNGGFQDNDPTIKLVPWTASTCILTPTILLTSSGSARISHPDYLGKFNIVDGAFEAGRPIWKNTKGKILKLENGLVSFSIHDDLSSKVPKVRSASAPLCPTDPQVSYSSRFNRRGWRFWDNGKWVVDNTIVVS